MTDKVGSHRGFLGNSIVAKRGGTEAKRSHQRPDLDWVEGTP
jgi:hypothetical protein